MSLKKYVYPALFLSFVVYITGCASNGREMSQENLDNIVIGTTTKDQMVAMFGPPLSQSFSTDGKMTMLWYYVHVGAFVSSMRQQNLAVLFDENEVVEKYNFVNNNDGARYGK